jgi:hypothetical protein
MKFADIPQLTRDASYRVNIPWDYLEEWLRPRDDVVPDLDPEFQRAHVWTEEQQIAFVEFMLRGGKGSNEIRFNCVGWMGDFRGPFVLVDGKQRLEAVRKFMANKLLVFGEYYFSDFEDRLRIVYVDFIMMVNSLPDMKSVLRWYLEINSGGTIHTDAELDKVRKLLEKETQR